MRDAVIVEAVRTPIGKRNGGLSGLHSADISASKLQFKGDQSAVGNFREHHVIRKFDQLANDELEKFSHPRKD